MGLFFPTCDAGCGVIGCIPISSDSFGFREVSSSENFFPRLKNSQRTLDIIMMGAYLPGSQGGNGMIGCVSILSDSFELILFFRIPRIRKAKNHKEGSFSHRRSMDGVIGSIPIVDQCSVGIKLY